MYGGVTNSQDLRKIADVVDKYEIPLVKMTGSGLISSASKRRPAESMVELDMPSGYAYGKTLRTVKRA